MLAVLSRNHNIICRQHYGGCLHRRRALRRKARHIKKFDNKKARGLFYGDLVVHEPHDLLRSRVGCALVGFVLDLFPVTSSCARDGP